MQLPVTKSICLKVNFHFSNFFRKEKTSASRMRSVKTAGYQNGKTSVPWSKIRVEFKWTFFRVLFGKDFSNQSESVHMIHQNIRHKYKFWKMIWRLKSWLGIIHSSKMIYLYRSFFASKYTTSSTKNKQRPAITNWPSWW